MLLPNGIAEAVESARLPPLPQLLVRLLQTLDEDAADVASIGTLVRQDPALADRVLAISNSAAFANGRKLASIDDCLVRLGLRVVRSLATCLAVQQMFAENSRLTDVELSDFWRHSLLTAELAQSFCREAGCARTDEAYLAGLLHDAGELILLTALEDRYLEILDATPSEADLVRAELSLLATDHASVGAWLVDHWQLDPELADAILFHHATGAEILTASELPRVVWLAHAVATSGDPAALAEASFAVLELRDVAALHARAVERVDTIAATMGLHAGNDARAAQGFPRARVERRQSRVSALDQAVGNMAVAHTLQQKLFALESNLELLLSLRESVRILFGLGQVAFVFLDPQSGRLTGRDIGGQPVFFGQTEVDAATSPSLVAACLREQKPRSTHESAPRDQRVLIDLQFARALGGEGLLCVPLFTSERRVGVMVCGLSQRQYERVAKRLPWLLNFGRIAASSFETRRQARDTELKLRRDAADEYLRKARRVSHEAGNPLGIIKSYLRILEHKLPTDAEYRQEVSVLREEVDRVASIVGRLSELPSETAGPSQVELNGLIREFMGLYAGPLFADRGIEARVAYVEGNSVMVSCDRDGLKQIVLNLCKNAAEAMGRGGKLTIEIKDGVIRDGTAYTELAIEDNGPGLPADALRRLYGGAPVEMRPGGRGMGLSIVAALAKRAGVEVTCRTRPKQGTRISLLLPVPQAPAASAEH